MNQNFKVPQHEAKPLWITSETSRPDIIQTSIAPIPCHSRPILLMRSIAQSLNTNPTWAEIRNARKDINLIPLSTVALLNEKLAEARSLMTEPRFTMELRKMFLCAVSYRIRMRVTEMRVFDHDGGYYVCPRCKVTMEREFQSYCDRCGQALD